jgi:CHASE2 domain-containing sensor protein
LSDDLLDTVTVVIARRNRQQRQVGIAAIFVAAGLVLYLSAVSAAALLVGNLDPR